MCAYMINIHMMCVTLYMYCSNIRQNLVMMHKKLNRF